MLHLSTGLRANLAAGYGIGPMLYGGVIHVYGGTPPASADDAVTPSELLGTITTDGNLFIPVYDPHSAGLALQFAPPASLTNVGAWILRAEQAGIATWFRWRWSHEDPLTESTYYPRLDGTIGTDFDLLVLPTQTLELGYTYPIDSFLLTLQDTV